MWIYLYINRPKQGRIYVGAGGTCPPSQIHFVPPSLKIQKLAGRSGVTSEVPKCYKMQIFRTPLAEVTALPRLPSWRGGCSLLPSQEPDPRSTPFGPRFYRSQSLTHYRRIANATNDIDFKCRPIWSSYFLVSENGEMDSVMKELRGQCPLELLG